MFKYRLPSRTGLFNNALQFELRKIRRQISESRDEGFRGLAARSMEAFRTFILSLGKPRFQFTPIDIDNNTTSREYYNTTRKTIQQDLVSAEEDVSNLGHASNESFNVASILARELETISAQAGSKAQDLALINRDDEGGALVAGDDFTTRNLVNTTYPLVSAQAYIDVNQGMVTLARTESQSVIAQEGVDINVKPITAGIDNKADSYKDNFGRFYEGRYYALAGQAEPEGGAWHLEELTAAPADNGFYSSYENKHSYDGGRTFQLSEYSYEGNETTINPLGSYVDENGEIVVRNEIIIRDRGATTAEKKMVRRRMIDGAPDTYWQCEYVFRPAIFGSTAAKLQGRRWTSFTQPGYSSNEKTSGNENFVAGSTTDLRGTSNEVAGESDARLQVTPDDLRNAAKSVDNMDMEITLTLTLPEPKQMNWLNLNPMNFGETAWLKIQNVEVAETRGSVFRQIPNFSSGRFQNILTEDVNHEVSSDTVEHIMAPNQYSYRGTGVWTFPTRQVQVIRFTIAQTVPTPVLYQKIRVQMHRIWEKVVQSTYKSDSRNLVSGYTKKAEWTKVITLEYLQSVQILQGSLTAAEVAPITEGSSDGSYTQRKDKNYNVFGDTAPALKGLADSIGNALGIGGGSDRKSSWAQQTNDSGFYMKGYWIETFYDLVAYRIGIRDIGAYMNKYEVNSEVVSVPYYSPINLKKVTLRVDDDTSGDTSIEYFISPDDGKNWYRINPLDKPSIYGEDGFAVPKTISFNIPGNPGNEDKYVTTDAPVRKILFKAELKSSSPTNSPIFRSYKLLMYPADSYRPQEFEV